MDIKLTLETKQINPGVINLKQHTNNTDTLVFVMEEYMYDTTDLSKLNAYAVCDMSGRIDEVKLVTEVSDSKLRITWKVTGYTTEVDGTITYQIVFKNIENEESKVWYSHKAIIFVNSSIEPDGYIAAKYPTILQQWEERMNDINDQVDIDLEEIREAVQTTTDNASKTDADAQKTAEDAERTQKLKEYVESIVNYEPSDNTGKEVAEARGDFLTLGQRLDDMDEKIVGVDVSWEGISGKPSVFPPSSHQHIWNDINDKPSQFPPTQHEHSIDKVKDTSNNKTVRILLEEQKTYTDTSITNSITNVLNKEV